MQVHLFLKAAFIALLLLTMPIQATLAQKVLTGRTDVISLKLKPPGAEKEEMSETLRIEILEPRDRGLQVVRKETRQAMKVRARLIGAAGATTVTINNELIPVTADGFFEKNVALGSGMNRITIVAADQDGRTATESLSVHREDSEIIQGRYFALVIGIDEYLGVWPPLENAVRDARAVAQTLTSEYGFDRVITLFDQEATRGRIIEQLEWLVDDENVTDQDQVLIYYSGHGQYVDNLGLGYWVPVDAKSRSTANYVANTDLQTFIRSIPSRHTLVVADACFAGDLLTASMRGGELLSEGDARYLQRLTRLASRAAITSGGTEPVMDGGQDGHSVFTYYLLKAMRENASDYLTAGQLFSRLEVPVVHNSNQKPLFRPIQNTGDEGGQFVFRRRN